MSEVIRGYPWIGQALLRSLFTGTGRLSQITLGQCLWPWCEKGIKGWQHWKCRALEQILRITDGSKFSSSLGSDSNGLGKWGLRKEVLMSLLANYPFSSIHAEKRPSWVWWGASKVWRAYNPYGSTYSSWQFCKYLATSFRNSMWL